MWANFVGGVWAVLVLGNVDITFDLPRMPPLSSAANLMEEPVPDADEDLPRASGTQRDKDTKKRKERAAA